MTCQESALGGSVPSCGSVAWPVKAIVSPTFHVSDEEGVSMKAVGAAAPAVTVIGALTAEAPRWSVTWRRAVKVPGEA